MVSKTTTHAAVLFSIILLFLVLWPAVLNDASIYYRVMTMAFFYGALAFTWNLHALTGSISLGHAAFFGLGAYGSALLNYYTQTSPYVTILFGGATGVLYGFFWNITFDKLRGARLALATLASVEIPKVIIDNWDSFTFGSMGLVGINTFPALRFGSFVVAPGESLRAQYYLLLSFMLLIGLLHWQVIRSRW
ncbi:MAG: hypothetical protein RBS57_04030, partial [Desulforhabdus sp.]|nr:hypothetical protein [Desulforhabdus sp.]